MSPRHAILQVLILSCLLSAGAMTAQSCKSTTKVQGTLLLVGNEPFTDLVLKTEDGYYRITDNAQAKELREKYQNQEVKLEGCTSASKKQGEIPRLIADIEIKKYTILKK